MYFEDLEQCNYGATEQERVLVAFHLRMLRRDFSILID